MENNLIPKNHINKKNTQTISNINEVLSEGYCIGCGACLIGESEAKIDFDENGFLKPELPVSKNQKVNPDKVCPFTNRSLNENELAKEIFTNAPFENPVIGKYFGLYASHVKNQHHRLNSSSGGILTEINRNLLNSGYVDGILAVGASKSKKKLFEYQACYNSSELETFSKSRYYPVEIGQIINRVIDDDKIYAIVALPCMTKAIRNLQFLNPKLKKKFPFISTLICGHLKSKFYTDFLAWQKNILPSNLKNIDYRHKSSNHRANLYSTKFETSKTSKIILNEDLALNDWGLGLFKPKACDFCDDVFGELGDIVVGDAWLPEYTKDYKGTSIVITRSVKADKLIRDNKDKIRSTVLSEQKTIKSQEGGVRHKRKGLFVRITKYLQNENKIPLKRLNLLDYNVSSREKKKFILRDKLRIESLEAFKSAIKKNDLDLFYLHINKYVKEYYRASSHFYFLKKIIKFFIAKLK